MILNRPGPHLVKNASLGIIVGFSFVWFNEPRTQSSRTDITHFRFELVRLYFERALRCEHLAHTSRKYIVILMQRKETHPYVVSSSSSRSPSDLISNGKKAGGIIIDVKISTFDTERVAKEVPYVELISSKLQYSRSDYMSIGRAKGAGVEVAVLFDVGSNLTSSFDVQDLLKGGLHVKIPTSNQKFSTSELRSFASKGKFTVICDDRRASSFDIDDILRQKGSAVFYTSKATNFSGNEMRGFSAKGHIEVIDDAKKLSSFDKDDIMKHHGVVRP